MVQTKKDHVTTGFLKDFVLLFKTMLSPIRTFTIQQKKILTAILLEQIQ